MPIEKIMGDIQSQIIKNEENRLMHYVTQSIGYKVDKDELIKALKYDRQQYEMGYADGVVNLCEDTVVDWMIEFIQVNGIKCLMELVMQAIEQEHELNESKEKN